MYGGYVRFLRMEGGTSSQVGAAALAHPLCGEAGQAGAQGIICASAQRSTGGRASPASHASAPFPGTASGSGARPRAAFATGRSRITAGRQPPRLREAVQVWGLRAGLQGQAFSGHLGQCLPETLMSLSLLAAAGQRTGRVNLCVLACACVCAGGRPLLGVGLPRRPQAGASPPRAGAGPGVEALIARGAPARGRSEAVCAELGQRRAAGSPERFRTYERPLPLGQSDTPPSALFGGVTQFLSSFSPPSLLMAWEKAGFFANRAGLAGLG